MKRFMIALSVSLLAAAAPVPASAQAKEQFVPVNMYWVGPYAPGGSGIAGGMVDYFKLINDRDGGINGVKITWEKCETEYNNARGVECYERSKKKGPTGATLIHPVSTGITYSLIEKASAVRQWSRSRRMAQSKRCLTRRWMPWSRKPSSSRNL